jgi:hypothetical protein
MARYCITIFVLLIPLASQAQGMDTSMPGMTITPSAPSSMSITGMPGGISAAVPMSQEGSGTSWHPASNPEYVAMYHTDGWMTMLHGHVSPRYDYQGGLRGGTDWDAPNYVMAMTQHDIGDLSQIMFRTMLSADWLTEGGAGYPLLLQTGETWQGKKLVDRQHPHDLFAEVSGTFSMTDISWSGLNNLIGTPLNIYLYLGYPGEPALGPPAFMHRLSAMSDPDAPITHHWQDATHITFGVITYGIGTDRVKLEGSVFNGSEPDENRTNFDTLRLNSYSARLSWNPTNDLALQASYGWLKNPEGDNANEELRTVSAIYTRNFAYDEWWSSSLVASLKKDHHAPTDQLSVLLESEAHYLGNAVYLRGELVDKPQVEMTIAFNPTEKERLGLLTVGVNRRLFDFEGVDLDLGIQGTIYSIPNDIAFLYGVNPQSFEVYFSIHPKELR